MPNTFFAMLARMKLIRRWGLMFSVREENLAEHTLDTAFFTHALIALHNARFLPAGEAPLDPGPGVQLALYHDAPEILTGDLPTPVKYFSGEIHTAYRAVEHAAAESLLHLLPEDLRREYRRWLLPTEELARYAPYVKAGSRPWSSVWRRAARATPSSAGPPPASARRWRRWPCRRRRCSWRNFCPPLRKISMN